MDDLNIQAGVTVNAEQAERAFDNLANQAQQMADRVTKAADKAGQATDGMGNGAEKSAEKFTRAESRISASIKRATNELELLGKTASQRLEFNISDKGLDAAKFEPALKKLRELEAQALQAQRAASGSLDKMGISAAQTAAALRGVPAQFTDIVTSLQGGQAPLTVFLQQGGQLKDMFGGAGNAARALGGYVLGLVNPFTIAAAAVAGIAVAYNQGAKEADAYRAALITTGNAAGTNAAQLKSYAQEISGVVGTQGKAAEALSALAATGKVGAENLREAAQAAVAYERATGQAASKTAEQFAALRNEPLAAVLKLNDGMNFLTDSTYKQIKSLEEQGKTAEAANVAQRAFADTLSGRAGEMERNLGTVERGWIAVKDAAKSAWDAILNVGRASTSVDQLADVKKQIAARENQLANDGFGSNGGGAAFGRPSTASSARLSAELTALKAQAAALEGVAFASKSAAEEERKRAESVKASAAFDKAGEKFLTDKIKMERELSAARVQGVEAGRSQAEIEKRLSEIRASYAKKGGGSVAAENKELRDQQRIFAELAGVSSTYYADLANAQKQRAAGVITEQQYVAAVEKLIQKQPFAVALAKEEADAAKTLAKANLEAAQSREKYIASLATGLDKIQADIAAQIEATQRMGLSKEAIAALDAAKLEMLATDLELQAIKAMDRNLDEQTYDALKKQAQAYRDLAKAKQDGAAKETMVDMAKDAAEEWKRTADSINQSLTDALMRGFESGKDFAKNLRDTVINMFNTMVLRPVISAIVNPVAGAVTGALGLSGAANAASGAGGGASMLGNVGSLFGAGGLSGSLAAGAGWLTGATTLGGSLSAGASLIGTGTLAGGMSGAGMIVGALGPIALGIGALSSIISSLDDSGTYHTGGAAQYSRGALRTSLGFRDNEEGLPSYNPNDNIDNQFGTGFGYVERGDQTISAVSTLAQSIGTALDGVAVAFGQKAGYEIATAFADDTSKDGAWGALRISKDGQELLNWQDTRTSRWAPREFGDGEEGYKQYLAAVAKDTRQVLLDMDLPSWADTMLTSIGDAANMDQLSATVQQIGAIQTTFVQLGKTMEGFAGLTDKAFEALMRASGGLEPLAANAGTYYENFYSEAEKTAAVTRSVSEALAQVGVAMPATRDEFRALVESQLAMGESGAEAVAALLGVSGAFASVVPAVEAISEDIIEAISEAMQRLQSDTAGLEIELLRAQGDTTGANAAQRTLDTTGFTEAEVALYDYNAALLAQIGALEAAAQQAEAMEGLRIKLLRAQGDELAAVAIERQKELTALQDFGPAAVAMQQQIYGIMDAMSALESGAAAYFAGVDRQQAAEDYTDQGSDALSKFFGMAAAASAGAAASTAQASADAATTAAASWRSAAQSIQAAIDGLRAGTTDAMDPAARYALTKATLDAYTVSALGGDADAASKLSGAANDFLNASESGSTTQAQYLRDRVMAEAKLASVMSSAQAQASVQDTIAASAGAAVSQLEAMNANLSGFASTLYELLSTQYQGADRGTAEGVASTFGKMQADFDAYFNEFKTGSTYTDAAFNGGSFTRLSGDMAAYTDSDGVISYLRATESILDIAKRIPELRQAWEQQYGLKLPGYAVGTSYVPVTGPALLHEGEAVIPKAFNPWAGGGQGNGEMLAELRALRQTNERLEARLASIEESNRDMATLLDNVTEGGNAMRSEVMA